MLLKTIITDVAQDLSDPDHITWSRSDLINFFNQAQRMVVLVRPDANSSNQSIQLVAGTKQTIPASAIRLLDVIRNMGNDGNTPGRVIEDTQADVLDSMDPEWHSATQSAVTAFYIYNEKDPKTFYVSPPSDGNHQIEVILSESPNDFDPEISGSEYDSAEITIDEIYQTPIMEWMFYKTYSDETSSEHSLILANQHKNAFFASLGLKSDVDANMSGSGDAPHND